MMRCVCCLLEPAVELARRRIEDSSDPVSWWEGYTRYCGVRASEHQITDWFFTARVGRTNLVSQVSLIFCTSVRHVQLPEA
jgi:hypothetical protein